MHSLLLGRFCVECSFSFVKKQQTCPIFFICKHHWIKKHLYSLATFLQSLPSKHLRKPLITCHPDTTGRCRNEGPMLDNRTCVCVKPQTYFYIFHFPHKRNIKEASFHYRNILLTRSMCMYMTLCLRLQIFH